MAIGRQVRSTRSSKDEAQVQPFFFPFLWKKNSGEARVLDFELDSIVRRRLVFGELQMTSHDAAGRKKRARGHDKWIEHGDMDKVEQMGRLISASDRSCSGGTGGRQNRLWAQCALKKELWAQ
jgi:hypothetical protein